MNYCTEFVIVPTEQTVAQGQEVVFYCQHSTARLIGWRLNDQFIDSSLLGVATNTTVCSNGVITTLIIEALLQYNLTRIKCLAFFDSSLPEVTDAVTLIIQGTVKFIGVRTILYH